MPDEIEVPLEHSQEHIEEMHKEGGEGKSDWTRFVAVATAIFAVIAALGALKSGLLVNEALIAKNEQIGALTQASDQWNYYQAEGIKALIYTTTAQQITPGSKNARADTASAAKYKLKQEELRREAVRLETEAETSRADAKRDLDKHHIFAFSVSLCQIAIALSAVAALTKRRRVWFFGLAAGLLGTALLIGGFLGVRLPFAF